MTFLNPNTDAQDLAKEVPLPCSVLDLIWLGILGLVTKLVINSDLFLSMSSNSSFNPPTMTDSEEPGNGVLGGTLTSALSSG